MNRIFFYILIILVISACSDDKKPDIPENIQTIDTTKNITEKSSKIKRLNPKDIKAYADSIKDNYNHFKQFPLIGNEDDNGYQFVTAYKSYNKLILIIEQIGNAKETYDRNYFFKDESLIFIRTVKKLYPNDSTIVYDNFFVGDSLVIRKANYIKVDSGNMSDEFHANINKYKQLLEKLSSK